MKYNVKNIRTKVIIRSTDDFTEAYDDLELQQEKFVNEEFNKNERSYEDICDEVVEVFVIVDENGEPLKEIK